MHRESQGSLSKLVKNLFFTLVIAAPMQGCFNPQSDLKDVTNTKPPIYVYVNVDKEDNIKYARYIEEGKITEYGSLNNPDYNPTLWERIVLGEATRVYKEQKKTAK